MLVLGREHAVLVRPSARGVRHGAPLRGRSRAFFFLCVFAGVHARPEQTMSKKRERESKKAPPKEDTDSDDDDFGMMSSFAKASAQPVQLSLIHI